MANLIFNALQFKKYLEHDSAKIKGFVGKKIEDRVSTIKQNKVPASQEHTLHC